MTYSAKVLHVAAPVVLKLDIELGFGVRVTKLVRLASVPVPQHEQGRIIHALVVLVGGKRVTLETDEATETADCIRGRVAHPESGVDVGDAIRKLIGTMDPVAVVKGWLNGGRRSKE